MMMIKTPKGRKKLSLNETHSEGSVAGTGAGVVRDLTLGVAGGVIGSAVGGPISLGGGAISLALGHYKGWHWLKPMAMGMILATGYDRNENGVDNQTSLQGPFSFKAEMENGKVRGENFLKALKRKFDLSQFVKPPTENSIEGLGDVDASFEALDRMGQQWIQEANQSASGTGVRTMQYSGVPRHQM